MEIRNQTVLIVGATSSLAQSVCHELAKKNCRLILSGRDSHELELLRSDLFTRYQVQCSVMVTDLLDTSFSAPALVSRAGNFDHIVIAAGDMGGTDADDLHNFAYVTYLNYTAPAQIATAAAQRMGEDEAGIIVIISSVAGDRGRASNYVYGSAKAALTAFASGLRNRYCRQDVHVMTVLPGFIDTPMTWSLKSPLVASRELVARKIVRAMEKKKDVIYVPWFWRYIMFIICHIPEKIFKRLSL